MQEAAMKWIVLAVFLTAQMLSTSSAASAQESSVCGYIAWDAEVASNWPAFHPCDGSQVAVFDIYIEQQVRPLRDTGAQRVYVRLVDPRIVDGLLFSATRIETITDCLTCAASNQGMNLCGQYTNEWVEVRDSFGQALTYWIFVAIGERSGPIAIADGAPGLGSVCHFGAYCEIRNPRMRETRGLPNTAGGIPLETIIDGADSEAEVASCPDTQAPPTPPEVQFWADRYTFSQGEGTTLRWDVSSGLVTLDGQDVALHDTRWVTPGGTTTYALRATGGGNTVERTVTLMVNQPVPSVSASFSADSASIVQGQCTTLRWNTSSAQSVTLDGRAVAGQGSSQVCPGTTTTYGLKAVGTGGTADRSVTVVVDKPAAVDDAQFIADVSVPDGTTFEPGKSFVKTWRVRNTGNTTWTADYQLAFVKGDRLGATTNVSVPQSVAPGETVDISVNMTAPPSAGSYAGSWSLRNSLGASFGQALWVKITVLAPEVPPFGCVGFGRCPTDTPMSSVPGAAPTLKITAFTIVADQLADFKTMQMPTELRPNVLRIEVTNVGTGPFNAPYPGGQYVLQILLKGPSGLLEEYTYAPGNPFELEPLASLGRDDTQNLHINDLFFFTPVEKGEMEVFLHPDASLGLKDSVLTRPVSVNRHPDSYLNCAATVGQALLMTIGVNAPPATKRGKIGLDASKLGLALIKCKDPVCTAVAAGTWLAVVAVKYLVGADLSQLLSLGADAGRVVWQGDVPCLKVADFMNAYLRQLLLYRKPVNGVITGSPVYPLAVSATGQRAGFLPDGQAVLEIPGAQAIVSGEERIVLYPGLDPVEVQITGYAAGTMDLTVTFASGSGGGSQAVFEDVPVTASTVARMSSAEPPRALEIREGDQAIHTLPPSRVEEVNPDALSTEAAPAQATAVPSTKGSGVLGGDIWLAALALLVAAFALALLGYLLWISDHRRRS
jgi:hypothetical protein